ncbi:DUF6542 domain-containing protein [Kitasatospora viridis]|uniref:DUF6542 domain-containing protein n=1 Tax=Kitasatospora viridis TaxID=281105 RepID=A0A561S9F5_9ACTN|nr:DUF6542 domain-containing protein [Kitasatospora viridis]TWF71509.1 hypothetical protein FHX73_19139 [Kitasatospora viridis]
MAGPAEPQGGGAVARSPRARSAVVLLLVGLPVAGALVDEAIGPGLGLIFGGSVVVGTAAATALASRAGWWWVLPACPTLVLALSAAAELLGDPHRYRGTKGLATGAIRWGVDGFPVMLAALGAAAVVVLVRIVRDRRNRRG